MAITAHDPQSVLAALEASDRFLVQQVFRPIANEYRISIPAPGSTEEGEPLLYVKQKRMKIKEDIRFRLSPDDGRHLFMIKSKTVFEFRGRHEVLDELDQPIGVLERSSVSRSCAAIGECATRTATSCSRRTRRAGSSPSFAASPT